MKYGFSKWKKWTELDELGRNRLPGIYAIARSNKNIADEEFLLEGRIRKVIIYVGMTNAQGGLYSRLRQFDRTIDTTIKERNEHGGAERVRCKYQDYNKLIPKLYVSIWPHECSNVKLKISQKPPKDLRIMGEVAKLEYDCLAGYVEKFKQLPEFNDKERSPKKKKKT